MGCNCKSPRHAPSTAGRVVHGAIGITKSVLGIDRASPYVVQQRMSYCRECPNAIGGRCTLCGCWIVHKARLVTESCPENRWPS